MFRDCYANPDSGKLHSGLFRSGKVRGAQSSTHSFFMNHRRVCCASKSDLSNSTKCDQNHISHICKLVTPKAQAKHEHLFIELALGMFVSQLL